MVKYCLTVFFILRDKKGEIKNMKKICIYRLLIIFVLHNYNNKKELLLCNNYRTKD